MKTFDYAVLEVTCESLRKECDALRVDIKTLVEHAASCGHSFANNDPERANESWRALQSI